MACVLYACGEAVQKLLWQWDPLLSASYWLMALVLSVIQLTCVAISLFPRFDFQTASILAPCGQLQATVMGSNLHGELRLSM